MEVGAQSGMGHFLTVNMEMKLSYVTVGIMMVWTQKIVDHPVKSVTKEQF